MKLNYINVVTNNPVGVINKLSNLLVKSNYLIEALSTSFDEKGNCYILVWIESLKSEEILLVISQIDKLVDVKEVIDMVDNEEQIQFLFNVNCNCKKTLKKISKTPYKINETKKEWIYSFMLDKEERESFIFELNNLKLPFMQRVIWIG
jgi:acetolactate synthase small subunit